MPVYSSYSLSSVINSTTSISVSYNNLGYMSSSVGTVSDADIQDIFQRIKELDDDAELRKRHPGLQELWEQYISFKALCEGKDRNDKDNS